MKNNWKSLTEIRMMLDRKFHDEVVNTENFSCKLSDLSRIVGNWFQEKNQIYNRIYIVDLNSSISGTGWLNTDVVNLYFQLIEERSETQSFKRKRLTTWSFPTVFYEFYSQDGYKAVKDMTDDVNIFEKKWYEPE